MFMVDVENYAINSHLLSEIIFAVQNMTVEN